MRRTGKEQFRLAGRLSAVLTAGLLAALGVSAAAAQTRGVEMLRPSAVMAASAPAQPAIGDEFMVVDCLLPGRVQRLGRNAVRAGPRVAERLTARVCEIRGGEYVASDRANYDTSLRVWLPQAEAGDARAQTYVGDIFAKGLGRAPDFAQAASWYRRAAEQDFKPAMFTLAMLLDTGSGVPKDPTAAAALYRRAAGIDASLQAAFAPPAATAPAPALASAPNPELERLRAEVSRLQAALTEAGQSQRSAETEAARARAEITAQRQELARARSELSGQAAAVNAAQGSAQQGVAAARETEARVAAATATLAVREADLARREAALKALDAQTGQGLRAAETEAARLRAERDAERQELERARAELAAQTAALKDAQAKLQSAAASSTSASAAQAAIAAREAEIAKREAALKALDAQSGQREQELAKRQQQLVALEQDLNRRREALVREASANQPTIVNIAPSAPPQIVMIDPEVQTTRGQPVLFAASDATMQVVSGRVLSGRQLVTLTINGQAVQPTPAGVFGAQLPVSDTPAVIQIVAVDDMGRRGDMKFELRRTQKVAPTAALRAVDREREVVAATKLGKFRAVLIGNQAYRDEGWRDLTTPHKDIEEIGRILRDTYGFEVEIVKDATRETIGSTFFRLTQTVGADESVLIYYAGHGAFLPTAGGNRGYWIPVDGAKDNPTNWISADAINDWVGMFAARKVMVVSDSCFSGLLLRGETTFLKAAQSEEARLTLLRNEAEAKSRVYLTSGRDSPVLDQGGGKGHSVFARAFMDVLADNSGVITGRTIYARVEQAVLYLSRVASRQELTQQPDYRPMATAGHIGGDFLFVPKI